MGPGLKGFGARPRRTEETRAGSELNNV